MGVLNDYNNAIKALYEHVGFVEDWVIYAIVDRTDLYWKVDSEETTVRYAEDPELFDTGDYYEDEVYHQRFYDKWVYRGDKLTMIFVDTHIDGSKFFAIYKNSMEVK